MFTPDSARTGMRRQASRMRPPLRATVRQRRIDRSPSSLPLFFGSFFRSVFSYFARARTHIARIIVDRRRWRDRYRRSTFNNILLYITRAVGAARVLIPIATAQMNDCTSRTSTRRDSSYKIHDGDCPRALALTHNTRIKQNDNMTERHVTLS